MLEQNTKFHGTQDPLTDISAKNLQTKKTQNNVKKKLFQFQTSKPKSSIKIRSRRIHVHLTWALFLTISCFFVVGPCWALYKISALRRMIAQKDFEEATRLSNRISSILLISTIIGIFAWMTFLCCSVGIFLTGALLKYTFI